MTNMQAAIGLAQLEELDEILAARRAQMQLYYELLKDVDGIRLRPFKDWCEPAHWLMTVTLDPSIGRAAFLSYMKERDVDCRQMVNPVHRADHFLASYEDADYPNANYVSTHSVHLPSSTHLSNTQIEYIVDSVKRFLQR